MENVRKEKLNHEKGTAESRRLKLGDTHPHTKASLNNLINIYEAWNRPEKAREWRAKQAQIEAMEEWHKVVRVTFFTSQKTPPRLGDNMYPKCLHGHRFSPSRVLINVIFLQNFKFLKKLSGA
jgi:hypothetical protein